MATIALCTEFPTDAGVLAIETDLESVAGGSHTVTVINDDNVGTQDFSSFDLIMTILPDIARATANGATYRSEINGGKPCVMHLVDGSQGAATGLTVTATAADLCGTVEIATNHTIINITDNTHEITDAFNTGQLTVWDAGGNMGGIEAGTIGDTLGVGVTTLDGLPSLVAIEQGTVDGQAVEVGARVVLCGFIRQGSDQENADHTALLAAMVEWALAEPSAGGTARIPSLAMTTIPSIGDDPAWY